jgi:ADP-ribosylglycohydrolase
MIPDDYEERVYAGVLGKIIGVYLGRPVEGWTYERIRRELGDIRYYVHDRVAPPRPLIVTDDDITGTFTFVRALADYGPSRDLTPAQIGQTWLNYIIERQTILWWGGMGNSTEHTAYVRLKNGIPAPHSGSIALNGKVVAEQIGAQIFIDGWGMVAPGEPGLAADLARKAASVSHDGEAIHGAQVIAAMEAQAFVEPDIHALLDVGMSVIPRDSLIYRLIADIRAWRKTDDDWRKTRARIEERYGYDKYGGNCHIVPNHAVIILALAYCEDDFQRALMIASTAGWDTDCNCGNVGCLMGIKNGLRGIEASPVDWRGPVADRLYLPTADGGRCITDAVQEAYRLARLGRALQGQEPVTPKGGARFHFELPGSVQGFRGEGEGVTLENVRGHSATGARSLAVRFTSEARASTATFIPPDALEMPGYGLIASPTLYPGQAITAGLSSDVQAEAALFVRTYGAGDRLTEVMGESVSLRAGEMKTLAWLPPVDGASPIAEVGVWVHADNPGTLYLDYLTWSGAPRVTFTRPRHDGKVWQRAWVKACDDVTLGGEEAFRVCQDGDRGLLIQGEREWAHYTVRAEIIPHLAKAAGLAACVQGTRRYYALALCNDQKARLIKEGEGRRILAEADFPWELDGWYELSLTTQGDRLTASINGRRLFDVQDTAHPLLSGAVALFVEEGRLDCDAVQVISL